MEVKHHVIQWAVRNLYYPLTQVLQKEYTGRPLRLLELAQFEDDEQRRTRQLELLRAVVSATANVPYYRDLWENRGGLPEVRTLDDLQGLPILTKDTVRREGARLEAPGARAESVETQTSGSSGTPLRVYQTRTFRSWHEAGQRRARRWFGVDVGTPTVVVWGRPIRGKVDRAVQDLKYRLNNMLSLSAWDLSPEAVRADWQRILAFRPGFVYAYPSAIAEIARQALQNGWQAPRPAPRVIMTTAETLHEHEREAIEAAFGAKVSNVYGCAEMGAFAHQCPHGGMHLAAENVLVEILRDGQPVPLGEVGDVVVTALRNHGMPLLRYAVGDAGRLLPDRCPCGRTLPLMDVKAGKLVEMVHTASGRVFSSALFDYASKRLVAEGQAAARFRVVQRSLDEFVVYLVQGSTEVAHVERVFREVLAAEVGDAKIHVETVPELPRDPGGKMRFFVSEVETKRA